MGGIGSGGKNHSGRATTSERLRLDVNRLRRAGVLAGEWLGSWGWKNHEGETDASIVLAGWRDRIAATYRWRRGEGEWRRVEAHAGVQWRSCRYGGERPFFVCPRCNETALHLYVHGEAFSCRHCQRLTYSSRREREPDRLFRRANTLRRRLGGKPGAAHDVGPRPKHMRWRTYDRMVTEIAELEQAGFSTFAALLWSMKRRVVVQRVGGRRRAPFWGGAA